MTCRGRRLDGQKLPERDTSAPPWPPLPLPRSHPCNTIDPRCRDCPSCPSIRFAPSRSRANARARVVTRGSRRQPRSAATKSRSREPSMAMAGRAPSSTACSVTLPHSAGRWPASRPSFAWWRSKARVPRSRARSTRSRAPPARPATAASSPAGFGRSGGGRRSPLRSPISQAPGRSIASPQPSPGSPMPCSPARSTTCSRTPPRGAPSRRLARTNRRRTGSPYSAWADSARVSSPIRARSTCWCCSTPSACATRGGASLRKPCTASCAISPP